MSGPVCPPDEPARLQALRGLHILDTDPDDGFDAVAQLACELTGCPIAMIGFVDRDRVWFKSAIGPDAARATPGASALCARAIGQPGILEVADARLDARFCDSPLARDNPGARFCAAVPLRVDRLAVGALCVIDRQPRRLSTAQRGALMRLGGLVARLSQDHSRSQRLEGAERRFGDVLAASGNWAWESQGLRVCWASDQVRAILGSAPGRYVGHAVTDGVCLAAVAHPEGRQLVRAALDAIRRREAFRDLLVRRDSPAGSRLISKSGVPVFGRDGAFLGYRGVARDVTAAETNRQRAEVADTRLRQALEALDETIVLTDPQDRIVLTNQRWRQVEMADPAGEVPRTYEAHLRAQAAAGLVADARGRESQWVAERVARRAAGAGGTFEASIGERDFLGRDTRLSDGSCLTLQRDITAIRASHREADESATRLQLAMDIAGVWIWEASLDDNLVLSPHGAPGGDGRLQVIRFADRLAQLPSSDRERMAARYRALWNGEIDRLEEEIVVEDEGRLRTLAIQAVVRPARGGRPKRLLGVARDVTVQRRAEAAARQKESAELANRTRSDFLSRVGHELRTPLNSIKGLAQVLARDGAASIAPAQRALVDHIVAASDHLGVLLDDLLDTGQLENGRLSLRLESVPLVRALRDSLRMVAPQAAARGIALEFAGAPIGLCVRADETRLRQIVLNLLTNAIKYNRPQGRVRLEAIADRIPGFVGVQVSDTGPGLTREQAARVFLPFERIVQIEGDHRGDVEGLGLGLAIAQGLASAMGGQIEVDSEVGAGSTFAVFLPASERSTNAAGEPATLPATATAPLPGPGAGVGAGIGGARAQAPGLVLPERPRRVLYVEDNRLNAVLMQQIAQTVPGLELCVVDSGEEALARAAAFGPDLVLMDNDLPGASGLQTFESMRRDPRLAAVPVILVSADAAAENVSRVRELGLADYWIKPLDVEKVIAALGGATSATGAAASVAATATVAPATVAPATVAPATVAAAVATAAVAATALSAAIAA